MQLKQQESGGSVSEITGAEKTPASKEFTKQSSSLPFGQLIPLSSISGPTYVTAQVLVQQVAYKLSDKIFSYSPTSFELDAAVNDWAEDGEKNIHGYPTTVVPLQTRSGAGAFALGYIFSKDFDLSKRHIPQTLLAPSLSLRHLRGSLDQLSLLYGVSSPFVAHIAAADYVSDSGLVTEYGPALQLAEELGLGLISSPSTYEAQHMSIFATLVATILPTLHVYDGLRTARETLRVVDTLSENGVAETFNKVSQAAGALNKRLDNAGKVVELLQAFNDELGTDYEPFEYSGHDEPEIAFVVFGSVEAQLADQVISLLASKGLKIGVVSVRIYRPFIEEAFLKALPDSVETIVVLGQVRDENSVTDASIQSVLYSDVLTATSFSGKWDKAPAIIDSKYAASEVFTPATFAELVQKFASKTGQAGQTIQLPHLSAIQQYTFWDVDTSHVINTPTIIGALLSKDSSSNVYLHETHDNLVQGGAIRTDIRSSKKSIAAAYPIQEADVALVYEEKLLKDVAVSKSVKDNGKLLLRLPNYKEEDLEKRVPALVRKDIHQRGLELYILDSALSPTYENEPGAQRLVTELAFFKIARPDVKPDVLSKLAQLENSPPTVEELADALEKSLHKIEIPAGWAEIEDAESNLRDTVKLNSFIPFEKEEKEADVTSSDWQAAAKALAFKEAFATQTGLRPDQPVKTYTIHVKENRRLTPASYDRYIFHIEFDLGNSGLTYKIGEALGIHADNDSTLVTQFIESYGLDADTLVQVPARDDATVVETRTIFQALAQNIDIFGKPPKRFYESLAEFATDETEKKKLVALGSNEGAEEFKRRAEIDTITYADLLEEFTSAHPSFNDLVRIVGPLKRREYSIASAQAVTPTSVSLMIVVVDWTDPKGRLRYGQATQYLHKLPIGTPITASVKPSVMKLPTRDDAPLIMAGLGTGLAPFRAFVQYRAMQKAQGKEIGSILLYLGSRHQREEYLYGEEWEAYVDAGVITLLGAAFSRDQPQKIYIQDRMRQTINQIIKAYIEQEGSFYLCGPTWPVPDVTAVLEEAIAREAKAKGKKIDPKKEIERLKEEGRYVLEVY